MQHDLVIVANRLPVHRRTRQGGAVWEMSPGGLVSALLPTLHTHKAAAWVGWCGKAGASFDAFEHEGITNYPVDLAKTEVTEYYDGMSNGTLWPLYHDVVQPPRFLRQWWRAYHDVNRRFAAAAAEVAAPHAIVWVHDYHLHLVPAMLRTQRPDLQIGFFLHIPFPDRRLFAQLPWRRQIVSGTLGADLVGLQTHDDASNFIDAASRHVGATAHDDSVAIDGRKVRIGAFPIAVDARHIDEVAQSSRTSARADRYRSRLGDRRILLGVDRLDYTKGIPHRLRAFQELLRSGRIRADEAVLVQSCVPSRERVESYTELRSEVEELVGQITGEFGGIGGACIQYVRQNLPLHQLVALYTAADVLLVTALRDGMNLIAKEYVAARHDEHGVVLLSEYTGAAEELPEALLVNPHDLDDMVDKMERALRMDPSEQLKRMRAMRRTVFANDVYEWADSFMNCLHSPRSREPLQLQVQ